jgi:hypothetical protein
MHQRDRSDARSLSACSGSITGCTIRAESANVDGQLPAPRVNEVAFGRLVQGMSGFVHPTARNRTGNSRGT